MSQKTALKNVIRVKVSRIAYPGRQLTRLIDDLSQQVETGTTGLAFIN